MNVPQLAFAASWVLVTLAVYSPAEGQVRSAAPAAKHAAAPTATKTASKPVSTIPASAPFTIGKDTTVLTRPLRPDGRVDYLSAVNAEASKGVTKDNNAAVPFIEVFGPTFIVDEVRPQVYKALGVAGNPQGPFLDIEAAKNAQYQPLQNKPWQAKDQPEAAKWLKDNEKILAKLVEASNRPRYFVPLAMADPAGLMMDATIPTLAAVRSGVRMLVMRANLATAEGRVQDAWNDILAAYRLAGLMEQDSTLVARLVGIACGRLADQTTWNLAISDKLDAKTARAMLVQLSAAGPSVTVISAVDTGERYTQLDSICWISLASSDVARTFDSRFTEGPSAKSSEPPESISKSIPVIWPKDVDWNQVLRRSNGLMDEMIAAMRTTDLSKRATLLESFEKKIRDLSVRVAEPVLKKTPVIDKTQWAGDFIISMLMPTLGRAQTISDTEATQRKLASVAIALAGFKAEKGKHPSALSELSPPYLKETPKDFFSGGKDFIYRPADGGYVLYSVGENGKDDGGKDRPRGGDDIVVRAERESLTK